MDHFRRVTTEAEAGKQNAVIMGRKTFESIPEANRPLRGRFNIVLSRNDSYRYEYAMNNYLPELIPSD